ncbi:MAG TPA: D-alanyl-D-alanine carboxypeptidase/D-alanyl-D-alanine-endopeptidase [Methylomirabilota bacterium]|nr:D-alanyl-D-alanine carboxypeptidase/D-alanyl-D-alanine-endopeptidase [Methylomirabilota bacterium]
MRELKKTLRVTLAAVLMSGAASAALAQDGSHAAGRFAARAQEVLSGASADKAEWGVLIVDADSGETLYSVNADKYFVPASNLKLFTTALALSRLGKDFRFRTTLETRGTISAGGKLTGDLVLVGRGDPNLSNRKFPYELKEEFEGPPEKALAELVESVVSKGVKEISGDIVADDSYFPRERYPSGWAVDDMVWSYGAAVSAIAVNDNTVIVTLAPGQKEGDTATFSVAPWTAEFAVRADVVTSPAGAKPDLTLTREPGAPLVVLRGTIPAKSEPRKLVLAIEEPAEHAATLLKRLLQESGVRVSGVARAQHEPPAAADEATVLAEHLSPPLSEAVKMANKLSENLHTEMLLRAAARQKGIWSTPEDLMKFAGDFYAEAGIAPDDVQQTDGSGLSRRDLITPRAVVTLLNYARRQPWFEAFYLSLPLSAMDGTLTDRMKNTPAGSRIRAKSGSVEHVRTLSGYVELPGQRRLVFSILSNNLGVRGAEATAAVDELCLAMVEEFGGLRFAVNGK